MNIEIAILEDNSCDYDHLCTLLTSWAEKSNHTINITWYKDNGILSSFFENNYDLLFADIELCSSPSANGLQICQHLRQQGYNNEIIILTAFGEYVFEGYNVRAFNYLVKPISQEKLTSCLNRFVDIHIKEYYCFQDRTHLFQLRFNDIIFIEKQNHNIVFHTEKSNFYERSTISKTIHSLPSYFLQCHKSCIINMTHVIYIIRNEVHLSDGSIKIIGRNYLPGIRNALFDLSKI